MCNICIPIMVGVAFFVLELKFGKTSPSDHGLYSPWGSKNKIYSKIFMQVEVDVMT